MNQNLASLKEILFKKLLIRLLDYEDKIENDGFISFLDFCKTFDRAEHCFILDTVEHLGFGECFQEMTKMLYKDIYCSIITNGHM